MLGKQAKILAPLGLADLLAFADCGRYPLRNRVILLLSAKAGLRDADSPLDINRWTNVHRMRGCGGLTLQARSIKAEA